MTSVDQSETDSKEEKPSFLLEALFFRDQKFRRIIRSGGKSRAWDVLSIVGQLRDVPEYIIPNDPIEISELIFSSVEETKEAISLGLQVELFALTAEGSLYAPGLLRRMKSFEAAKQRRVEAARKAAAKRHTLDQESKPINELDCQTNDNKPNVYVCSVEQAQTDRRANAEQTQSKGIAPPNINTNTNTNTNLTTNLTKDLGSNIDLGSKKKRPQHPKILGFTLSSNGDDWDIPKDYQTIAVSQAVEAWLDYKAQFEPYKGLHGMKSLFSQAAAADATTDFVCWAITYAIAHDTHGIHFGYTAEKYLEETGKQPKRTKQMQLQGGGNGRRPLTETINVETVKEMCRQKGLI